jgi:hypothetical protein
MEQQHAPAGVGIAGGAAASVPGRYDGHRAKRMRALARHRCLRGGIKDRVERERYGKDNEYPDNQHGEEC